MLINISIGLIILCLIIILIIALKKFPALAILDTENIPEEKENKFKEKIIRERFERDFDKYTSSVFKVLSFIYNKSKGVFKLLHNNLKKVKEKYQKEKQGETPQKKQDVFGGLIKQAQELANQEEYQKAEQKYIEALALNDKSLFATFNLAEVYWDMKNYKEAKETYDYALKLAKHEDNKREQAEIYYDLSQIHKQEEDIFKAIDAIHSALEVEENNPRFLDFLLELEIKNEDKKAAREVYDKLKTINPENKKLEEYQQALEEME